MPCFTEDTLVLQTTANYAREALKWDVADLYNEETTAVLAEQFKAVDPVPEQAKEYGGSEESVRDAIRCERNPKAA